MKKLADLDKQRQREQKRKEKHLQKLREKEVTDINSKIVAEEKKLLETQRKLESVRLLEAIFDRISVSNFRIFLFLDSRFLRNVSLLAQTKV